MKKAVRKGSRRKKGAALGAEMLIELGRENREVGYIKLDLVSPEEDQGDRWVLKVERWDPLGGAPWEREFLFDEESTARYWFSSIRGDEDLYILESRQREA